MSKRHDHSGPDRRVVAIKHYVRADWLDAQTMLLEEYKRPGGPRWTLVQWLKRHRVHNPTTRVIPASIR